MKFTATMNSNGFPFSEQSERIICADSVVDAIAIMLAEYDHPARLFSAIITVDGRMVARFSSARANAQAFATKRTTSTVRDDGDRFVIRWCGDEQPIFVKGFSDVTDFFDDTTGKLMAQVASPAHDEHNVTPFPR
jgi:hypothetical protein